MGAKDDQVLRTAKEIIVKFIETGRIYPTNFSESFKMIYRTIHDTVEEASPQTSKSEDR